MPDCERLKHAARAAGVSAFDGTAGVGSESRTCDSLCLCLVGPYGNDKLSVAGARSAMVGWLCTEGLL